MLSSALGRHRRWSQAWRIPTSRKAYDVVIVGAGGHGLATAYHLAKKHGIRNVAVLEKGWSGGGNTGRNTQLGAQSAELESLRRWTNAIQVNGTDSELMTPEEIKRLVPLINLEARFPCRADSSIVAAAFRDTTPWRGAMRAAPTHWASISFNNVKSLAFAGRASVCVN